MILFLVMIVVIKKDVRTLIWTGPIFIHKNGKMYKIGRECFIKKVRCEFCKKELNKSYLRSHQEA